MPLVDQTRIGRRRGLGAQIGAPSHDIAQWRRQIYRRGGPNPRFDRGTPAGIKGYGDYGEIVILQFFVDGLPDWQVEAASSPGGPGHQQDFVPTIIRQRVQLAIEVRQSEIGRHERMQALANLIGRFTE